MLVKSQKSCDYNKKFENSSVLKKAKKVAMQSTYEYKLGAVVFKGNRIISSSENKLRYSSKLPEEFRTWYGSLHAEQAALINSKSDTKGYSLLVVRLGIEQEFRMAKPCEMCQGFAKYKHIRDMYYTTNEGTIERLKL